MLYCLINKEWVLVRLYESEDSSHKNVYETENSRLLAYTRGLMHHGYFYASGFHDNKKLEDIKYFWRGALLR